MVICCIIKYNLVSYLMWENLIKPSKFCIGLLLTFENNFHIKLNIHLFSYLIFNGCCSIDVTHPSQSLARLQSLELFYKQMAQESWLSYLHNRASQSGALPLNIQASRNDTKWLQGKYSIHNWCRCIKVLLQFSHTAKMLAPTFSPLKIMGCFINKC